MLLQYASWVEHQHGAFRCLLGLTTGSQAPKWQFWLLAVVRLVSGQAYMYVIQNDAVSLGVLWSEANQSPQYTQHTI